MHTSEAATAGDAALQRAADRAATRPGFMAHVLAQAGKAQGESWSQVAACLGCTGASARQLALCREPQPGVGQDIVRIARYARADAGALARITSEQQRRSAAVASGPRPQP